MEQHGSSFKSRLHQPIIAQTSCLIASQTTIKTSPQQNCCGGFLLSGTKNLASACGKVSLESGRKRAKIYQQTNSPIFFRSALLWLFSNANARVQRIFLKRTHGTCFERHFLQQAADNNLAGCAFGKKTEPKFCADIFSFFSNMRKKILRCGQNSVCLKRKKVYNVHNCTFRAVLCF